MMPAPSLRLPRLADLLQRFVAAGAVADVGVSALELDSRRIEPGAVFVALQGGHTHGCRFLDQALGRGAVGVLHEPDDPAWDEACSRACRRRGVAAVAVPDLRRRLGAIAARFHGDPASRFETIAAVTGTDGKTSVTHYLAAMLDDTAAPAAVLGTLGTGRPGATADSGLTTPDALRLQETLAALADDGVRRLALEASSHGLAQYRLDGTRIDVAVLTHLGRDHLDYHADSEAYSAAKRRLFHWPGLRAAVLNLEDAFGAGLAAELDGAGPRIVTYGHSAAAELWSDELACEATGLRCRVHHAGAAAELQVPLLGAFNRDNLLAAIGALLALGWSLPQAARRAARVQPVPGRMELFRTPGRAGVVVDYAHNAGALAAALEALRAHASGRLWCIFGAGGDRDRGKRPLMGDAAVRGADHVIVTDDNPRSESPEAIVDEILAGVADPGAVEVEHDRGRALQSALERAAADDLILLAGKGHETGQLRGGETREWSDRAAARAALEQGP